MTYSILPAQPSDVSDIALISHDAFKDDPIVGQLTPNVPREADHAWQVRSLTGTIANAERDGVRFMKAIDDESGKMVAFAKWQYPHALSPAQKAEKEASEETEKHEHPRPEGTNTELIELFKKMLRERRVKHIDQSTGYFLHLLCVLPTHQRLGIGTLLIRQGLDVADAHNANTYIEASPKGLQLYLRFGWKQVDDIVIDMNKYGGSGMASEKCLLREPRAG